MIYDNLIRKVSEGYGIGRETYDDKTVVYSLVKVDSETERTVFCEIAYNIARKLIKEARAKMVFERDNIRALNFIPMPVKPGCVRFLS